MATKTFGIKPPINNTYWGGIPYHANIGFRTTMPERGKIVSLALRLARYSSSDVPIVWGTIWNRSNGILLAKSNNTHSPNNTYTTYASLQTYTFNFDRQVIEGGTPLWIGYGKRSDQSGRTLRYGTNNDMPGYTIDRNDESQSSPATTFVSTTVYSNHALWVEVTYESGGQIKVWNGTSFIELPVKAYVGSSWIEKPLKHYNNGLWTESN